MTSNAPRNQDDGLVAVGGRATVARWETMNQTGWTCVFLAAIVGFTLSAVAALVTPDAFVDLPPDGEAGRNVPVREITPTNPWGNTLIFHQGFTSSVTLSFGINANASLVPPEGITSDIKIWVSWLGHEATGGHPDLYQEAIIDRKVACIPNKQMQAAPICDPVLLFTDNFVIYERYTLQIGFPEGGLNQADFIKSIDVWFGYESYEYSVLVLRRTYFSLALSMCILMYWFYVCYSDKKLNDQHDGRREGDEEEDTRRAGCLNCLCDRVLCCCFKPGCFRDKCFPYGTPEQRWVVALASSLCMYNNPFYGSKWIENSDARAAFLGIAVFFQGLFGCCLMAYFISVFEKLGDIVARKGMVVFRVVFFSSFLIGYTIIYCQVLSKQMKDHFYDYWYDQSITWPATIFLGCYGGVFFSWLLYCVYKAGKIVPRKSRPVQSYFLSHIWRLSIIFVGIAAGAMFFRDPRSWRLFLFYQFFFNFMMLETTYIYKPVPAKVVREGETGLEQGSTDFAQGTTQVEFTQVAPRDGNNVYTNRSAAVIKDTNSTQVNLTMI